MPVRVRCAPSPTGYLHIGVTRTALFNFLHARHNQGRFLLRIEDTDKERSREEYTRSIQEGFAWVGIHSDEPPIFQSQRQEYYQSLFNQLLSEGKAYRCDCSKERLEELRASQSARGLTPQYDGHCRERTDVSPAGSVIRLKTPHEGTVALQDSIYGEFTFNNADCDDYVIAKSDGTPTYQFAVVADDHAQGVTLVIRGNDLFPSTHRQILLYQAFGWDVPGFAHLPMILGADKQKLSKRHGATSLLAYRAMGYLPQAMCNYLVRLGWAYGDQEVFQMDEMIEKFTIDSIGKSPAVFNPDKLLWLNGEHIRLLGISELTEAWLDHLDHLDEDQVYLEAAPGTSQPVRVPDLAALRNPSHRDWVELLVGACQGRSSTLVQLTDHALPFLIRDIQYDARAVAKVLNAEARIPLTEILGWVQKHNPLPDENRIHEFLDNLAKSLDIGLGKVAQPVRVAVTGRTVSPPINTTLLILEKSQGHGILAERLQKALLLIPKAE